MSRQLRLLKVIVQPVFVVDDGEALTEVQAQPGAVSAADWPSYATTAFLAQVAEFEAAMNQEPAPGS